MRYSLLIFFIIVIISCNNSENKSYQEEHKDLTLAEEVAHAYNIENFDQVEKISYEFVVHTKDTSRVRSWSWEPKKDKVTFTYPGENGEVVSYIRSEMDTTSEQLVWIDMRFINDNYWMLFPFHLMWDSDITTEVNEEAIMPISGKKATELIVKYGDAGYTPGDVYKLYLDKDHIIKEWVFMSSGSEENSSPKTWSQPEQFGPIMISTDHYNPDSSARIELRNIKVETTH